MLFWGSLGERVSGKGSEVFEMCDEIELKLNGNELK